MAHGSPAVSVLLPFRNAATTLADCLDSIRAQSLTDFEVIGVDDASEDDSAALFQALAEQDPRFKQVSNPCPGLVNALNLGLQHAHSPLVARMDADDCMHARRLQKQWDYFQQHPTTDVLGCAVEVLSDFPVTDGFQFYIDWLNSCQTHEQMSRQLYVEAPFAHPSVMFRTQAVLDAGGYRSGEFPEDYELWLRLHGQGATFAKLSETLLQWRDHPERLSRTADNCSREAFDRLRAEWLAKDQRLNNGRLLAFWGAGKRTRQRVAHLLNKGFEPAAWIDIDPKKIGNRLKGVPVVAPQWLEQEHKPFVLSYVANHGAREDIAALLSRFDYQEGQDYLFVG